MPTRYIPSKKGYQWGDEGHLYRVSEFGYKGAKEKADLQGTAILYSQGKVKVLGDKNKGAYIRKK